METFAQEAPTLASKVKSGLVVSTLSRIMRTLSRVRRVRANSPLGDSVLRDNQVVVADMHEIGVLSRTLVQASMDAARAANQQRQQVTAVLRIEEGIRALAKVNLEDSTASATQTEQMARDVEAGTQTIESTNRTMSEMVKTVASGAEMMEKFAASIREVNRVVGQIHGIARQTNLLALNAAVEASHAGAEGDGFNVIAQEIRLLADRTSTATSEIGATMREVGKHAAAAGAAMQAGRSAAETSIEETGRVQESLEAIRESMASLLDLSKRIADSSGKQLAAGEEAAQTVRVVNELAAESTMGADSAAEMSIKMVRGAESVQGHLEGRRGGESVTNDQGRRATDRVLLQVDCQKAAVLSALSMLREDCRQSGEGILHGTMRLKGALLPGLYFGGTSSVDGTSWVDGVHERTGCGATVFVLAGEQFIRVATNVKLPSGERATGTVLNPKGLAVAALRTGRSYFGAVYVLGNPFVAGYEPIFSGQGKVIGALYTGKAIEWEDRSASERARQTAGGGRNTTGEPNLR